MPSRTVPPELCEIIVAEVACPLRHHSDAGLDDIDIARQTIASCALVSREWRNIAQGFQFENLVVEFKDPRVHPDGRTLGRFQAFVEASPRLASAIRSLHLRYDWSEDYERWATFLDDYGCNRKTRDAEGEDSETKFRDDFPKFESASVIDVQLLFRAICHLQKLESLEFSFADLYIAKEEELASLYDLRVDSLTRFSQVQTSGSDGSIHRILFYAFLAPFVNLRELNLQEVEFCHPVQAIHLQKAAFDFLTHVTIRHCRGAGQLLSPLYIAAKKGLPTLEWVEASYLGPNDVEIIQDLVTTLGSRLKHLGLEFMHGRYEWDDYPSLTFAACFNLRSFLFIIQNADVEDPDGAWDLLRVILEDTLAAADPASFALEDVIIEYTAEYHLDSPDERHIEDLNPVHMTALQDTLLRFPQLKQLEFRPPILDASFDHFGDGDRDYVAELMPTLKTKSMLVF